MFKKSIKISRSTGLLLCICSSLIMCNRSDTKSIHQIHFVHVQTMTVAKVLTSNLYSGSQMLLALLKRCLFSVSSYRVTIIIIMQTHQWNRVLVRDFAPYSSVSTWAALCGTFTLTPSKISSRKGNKSSFCEWALISLTGREAEIFWTFAHFIIMSIF